MGGWKTSGLGYHGPGGIQNFRRQHQAVLARLGFAYAVKAGIATLAVTASQTTHGSSTRPIASRPTNGEAPTGSGALSGCAMRSASIGRLTAGRRVRGALDRRSRTFVHIS